MDMENNENELRDDFETIEMIASHCHDANKAFCDAIGDHSQVEWEDAGDRIRQSAIDGVVKIIDMEITTPADSHSSWMKFKLADGWKYGPVKDSEKKEHPCIVEYSKLPPEQIAKDFIFFNIVKAYMEAGAI